MAAEDYFLLGRALSRTGQDDQALKTLEMAKAADPDRLEMLDELAQVYFRKDLPAAAEAIAERLIREPGWEVRGQLLMGTCLAARNDPAGAARALQRAFQLDPAGKAAAPQPVEPLRMLLVRSWLKSGQPTEARRVLEMLPVSGSDPESAWLLSRCFLQEGDLGPATAALERAGSYRGDWPLDPEPATYVGEAKCASCHAEIARSVLASHHSTTFSRPTDPGSVSMPDRPLADPADPQVSHSFGPGKDGLKVEAKVGDQVYRALARYAFGIVPIVM